jgi:hypothetical protein
MRVMVIVAGVAFAFLAGCGQQAKCPTVPGAAAVGAVSLEARAKRIDDLVAVKAALDAYAAANAGAYPKTEGWNGFNSAWGASLGADWIPGLVPTHIAALPRDPALSDRGDGPQYIYFSDGKDYKLLAHYTNDCGPEVETRGVRIDVVRGCNAYGFWTEGGAGY